MKVAFVFCFSVAFLTQQSHAQLSVNADWRERSGLAVASSESVSVPATRLRCFTTIESIAADPRTAIGNLKQDKTAIVEALAAVGLPANAVAFTTEKILEWEMTPQNSIYYRVDSNGLSPRSDLENYTAMAHVSFDVSLDGVVADEIALKPFEICQQLRRHAVFDSREIFVLFIGEIGDTQMAAARKKAYDEAFDEAKALASLSERSLGKLAALTPETDGRWRYASGLAYGYWTGENAKTNPLANFMPAENEVFGSDAFMLSRTFTIELRFNIE